MHELSFTNWGMLVLIYALLGWVYEASAYALVQKKFSNRGLLSVPLNLSYGCLAGLLMVLLPRAEGAPVMQFFITLAVTAVVGYVSRWTMNSVTSKMQLQMEPFYGLNGSKKGFAVLLLSAGMNYAIYLIVHPLLLLAVLALPTLLKRIILIVLGVLIAADFVVIVICAYHHDPEAYAKRQEGSQQKKLFARLSDTLWKRLRKAYPEIQEVAPEKTQATFAKGLCLDKLIWVFLVSSLLGDLIETVYCGILGHWMSRSSVLYGPFSFVWGIGAVVLTISLQEFAKKSDRYVFLAGCVIGGVYEYMCSVFTELVFGTVFWDYSHMPFNFGGRTNLLFCFFWGILSVVWMKMVYPRMAKWIEKIPPVAGKVLTWVVMIFMVCNALLTSAAMIRYNTRLDHPEPANAVEALLDERYPDEFMERRWANMIRSEDLENK